MPGKFNYEFRHKYPHMIGEDSAVWSRFIIKFPEYFDTVDYDMRVGRGSKFLPEESERYNNYWTLLTQKRIDVVGYKKDFVTLLEVKKRASLFTLGQILGYKFLYLRDHKEIPLVRTLIICSSITPDDIDILNHFGIKFFVI